MSPPSQSSEKSGSSGHQQHQLLSTQSRRIQTARSTRRRKTLHPLKSQPRLQPKEDRERMST
eukprot:384649-Amphidinium_carterae.2